MPALSRRNFAFGAAALPLFNIRAWPANAAEFTYKFGHDWPALHPINVRCQEAVDRIFKETNGRVEIRLFPNNQLGSATDSLSQLRSGALEFFAVSGLILSTFVPPASIHGIGFAFSDYDQVWRAMDGKLGAYVRSEINKRGLVVMEKIWDNGFRQTTTATKPIRTAADFKGMKIRVPVSPLWTSMFQAFGASPASINLAEVYTALQTKIVDGQENALSQIETAKLYEVQKYCSLTNHMWDGPWLLANRKMFERLPKDAQEIVAHEFNASAVAERADNAKWNAEGRPGLETKGLIFNEVENAGFRDALKRAGFYKEWRGKYGEEAWRVLEDSVGAVS